LKETTLFLNNKTQSVRIPKEDQFSGDKVLFQKFDGLAIIIDKANPWSALNFAQMIANGEFMNEKRSVNKTKNRESLNKI
jgi:antitoxin VapB